MVSDPERKSSSLNTVGTKFVNCITKFSQKGRKEGSVISDLAKLDSAKYLGGSVMQCSLQNVE